jgi:ABC-type branched-subunit amino acid transport system substrate-binding protein
VDTSACNDPEAAEAPITGTLSIGSAQPLSGTPAVAFAPVTDGLKLYLDYANKNNLLPGVTLTPNIQDDQYDATQTPGVVSALIDAGVNIFSGIIGTPNNLAVRDTLNEECIPQLLNLTGAPDWGNDVAAYPWTTGALVPYDIEARIYATSLKGLIGDGGTVGMFTVNSEFGKTFADAFKEAAAEAGLKIVDEQTIEPEDQAPPTNQVGSIASKAPAAVLAVPLGLQCPTFLKEVVNAKAANSGWDPKVFLTNTCASRLLISQLAGGAGDGVYTSGNIVDPSDPANADNEGVKLFKAQYDGAGLKGDLGTTAVGWSVGEITVAILKKAQDTGTLSRKSIIEAARNMTYKPSLERPGADYKMNGEEDGFSFQTLQVEQWNEASQTFTNIGEPDTSSES